MHIPRLLHGLVSRLNLWTRLVLVLIAGFVTLFGVFSLVSLRVLDDSTQRILTERQVIAEIEAQRYDDLLSQAYYELDKATTFAAFNPSAPDLSNENHMLAHAYGRLGSFSLGVVFLDARGRVVLVEPDDGKTIGADYAAFPFIAQVIQTQQRSISDPFLDPRTRKPAVAVTIPIVDGQQRMLSILSGWIDLTGPSMRTPVEQARKLGETGHAELVDDHGMVIASTEGHGDVMLPGDHRQFYLRMLAAHQEGVETVPEEYGPQAGEMHVMAFAPLTMTHWGIAVGGTEAETFAPVRALQGAIFFFGALSFVVIFLATLWGARLLVRPVKALTDAAKRIADGDLSSSIKLGTGGEIGVLADSFETMRAHLQQSHTELTGWSTELEKRVQERTRELETLYAELQREEGARRQLLERVINAQEEERMRVARELHDETGQALTALLMSLDAVEASDSELSESLRERLARTKRLTQDALRNVRSIIFDLRPTALDDLGLVPAIRRFAEQHLEPLGIALALETHAWPKTRLPPSVETVLFRVMQEAINNIARHANAHQARIIFEADGVGIIARVQDDGEGFDPATPRGGLGLVGMRERANLIGGRVEVHSAPGGGTQIEICIPLQKGQTDA
jgi:signal transduction histidine kinase